MRKYLFISVFVAALLLLADGGAAESRVPADGCRDALAGRICDADTGSFAAERRYGSDIMEPVPTNVAGAERAAAAQRPSCGARAAAWAGHIPHGSWRTASAAGFCGLFIVPRRTADYYVLRLRRLII
ncbi:MAG: hypothetical protein K2J33_07120 [Alistipes sp.]|nr:hypothetical protein [Alistipes sp.]